MSSFDPFGYQGVARALDRINNALSQLAKRIDHMALDLTGLKAAVAAESVSVDHVLEVLAAQSASLADIKQQLADALAANDPAELQSVIDSITAEQAKVDAAVAVLNPTA